MTSKQILLAIVINSIWVIPMIYELVIVPIQDSIKLRKRNKEYDSSHNKSQRLKCVDCKYCISFLDRAFHKNSKYANFMRIRVPKYCKRFKTDLHWDSSLRCISKVNEFAMYEDKTSI